MSNGLMFWISAGFSLSVLMVIYQGHAQEKGMQQGLFFASGKAMLMGYAGLIATLSISLAKGGMVDTLICGAISCFVVTPLLLSFLGYLVQPLTLIGLPISIIIMLTM